MSIRIKLILCFSSVVICAIGFLISYITIFQKNSYIQNEESNQVQVLSLVNNNVVSQVYNLTSDQVTQVLAIRSALYNQSDAFKKNLQLKLEQILQQYNVDLESLDPQLVNTYIKAYQHINLPLTKLQEPIVAEPLSTNGNSQYLHFKANNLEESSIQKAIFDFLDFLEKEQYILNSFNMDLVVTYGENIAIWPSDKDVFTGTSVSNRRLLSVMSGDTNTFTAGYFLSLFNKNVNQIFNINSERLDRYSLNLNLEDANTKNTGLKIDPIFLNFQQQKLGNTLYKSDVDPIKNYLSIIFTLTAKDQFKFAIVRNIDQEIEQYNQIDEEVKRRLEEYFVNLKHSLDGEILILNQNGELILSSEATPLFTQTPKDVLSFCKQEAFSQYIEKRQEGSAFAERFKLQAFKQIEIKGESYLINTMFIESINWYVINVRKFDEIISPAIDSAKILLFIGIGCLFFALCVSVWMSEHLTKPLVRIARKARVISKSNLSDANVVKTICSEIKISGKDEIAALGNAINYMGNSISYNINMLMKAQAKQNRVEGELNAARDIQMGMLLSKADLPKSSYLDHMATLCPAKEVGGDFYDILRLDNKHIAYMIGDVSDKGVPAALFMSMTLTLARACLIQGMTVAKTMQFLNDRLSQGNPNMMFVTMFIMILNEQTGHIHACNAGHCLPIILHTQDTNHQLLETMTTEERTEQNGPAIGAIGGIEFSSYDFTLEKGDFLYLYTDGVSEAQNDQEQFFGTEAIHKSILDFAQSQFIAIKDLQSIENQVVEKTEARLSEELIKKIDSDVAKFRGYFMQSDDITMLALYLH